MSTTMHSSTRPSHLSDAPFRNLSPLPAVFPAAVNRPDDFFDQEEVFHEVIHTLRIGARRPILLQGERGIGKSSMLLRVKQALQNDAIPERSLAYFFISPGRMETWEQFAWELLDGLSLTLEALGLPTRAWGEGTAQPPMTFNRLVMQANRLMEPALYRNPRLGIVVAMDEIDKGVVRPQVLDKILASIHYLVEKTQLPLYFLMTIIARKLPDPPAGSPMPVKFVRIPLLPEPAQQEMIACFSRSEGMSALLPNLQRWIPRYSGGHPYIVKLLLSAVLREHGEKQVADWEPERFLARAIRMDEARQLFGDVYRRFFSEEEKAIMLELAARDDERITQAEVESWPSTWQRAVLDLEDRGYLQRTGDMIHCRMGMWPTWLRAWPVFSLEKQAHPLPHSAPVPQTASPVLPPGICIIRSTQQVFVDGQEIDERTLSRTTYRALLYLAEHGGEVVSRDELGRVIYPDEHFIGTEQQLDSIISRLRKALGDKRPYRFIKTLRGRGYRMEHATVLDTHPAKK